MKKVVLLLSALLACNSCGTAGNAGNPKTHQAPARTEAEKVVEVGDTVTAPPEIKRLTEVDYEEVAKKLGVEVAMIKAVTDIEAGRTHEGFVEPGVPLINFDLTMFRRFAAKKGINLGKYQQSHAVVFSRPNARRYGSHQAAQHARLKAARSIDNAAGIEGTFWGMFQIGGFNWKKCGATSLDDFVMRMSRSERDQLDMFANFLISTGLDKPLRAKNWAAFARGYNGPAYASRSYHTRMASAYARHKSSGK